MAKLILLYWGCVLLVYLSQVYYPAEPQLTGKHIGRHSFMWRKADIFMVIVIAWMTCFSFLRTSYNDTLTYIDSFRNAETLVEGFANGTFTDWTGNPWSMFYRSLMHDLTKNYHIYFFFPAFLSSFAVVKLCKRYSVNPAFSLLIFFSIGTYVMYIAALKQCLAMFFLLLALPYAIDKKYAQFYLLVLVAIFFHTHAFMFAIVPLLLEKPWGKVSWGLLGATAFAMATYDFTLGAFMEYAQSIGALVAEVEVFDDHQINILRVLVYWVPALFALIFRKRLFSSSGRTENLFVNMSMVSAFILTIGLVRGANLYARMAAYFEIGTAIALPWMFQKLFTRRSAQFVTIAAAALYFGYFLYEFSISKDFSSSYSSISLWEFIVGLFA
ncbi:MAG: EpsG family protein [Oscillospiraceae bacterium]